MSSWCHIFAPFWHIPTWFVCMCCNNALIMGSVVHKCVYDVCVCVSCMTLRRLLLVTPIWMIPTPLGDLFRPFIFPPPRSRELRSGAKWPVSTDTVPKRVPLRRAAAPGAGRQRRRDPLSRLVLQPFLPLHAQVFPTRAQRWRRPRYHVGTNLDINLFFFILMQLGREHAATRDAPRRRATARKVGMKAPWKPPSGLRMRWRRTGKPTTTR